MFQRIQNYLLLLMLAMTLVFVVANVTIYNGSARIDNKDVQFSIGYYMCQIGDQKVMNTYLFIATNFLALFIVSTLRSFKNLTQQLLGAKVIFVLLLAVTYLTFFPQGKINEVFSAAEQKSIQPLAFGYLILIVLNVLVYRGIAKDKALLESVDRLR